MHKLVWWLLGILASIVGVTVLMWIGYVNTSIEALDAAIPPIDKRLSVSEAKQDEINQGVKDIRNRVGEIQVDVGIIKALTAKKEQKP